MRTLWRGFREQNFRDTFARSLAFPRVVSPSRFDDIHTHIQMLACPSRAPGRSLVPSFQKQVRIPAPWLPSNHQLCHEAWLSISYSAALPRPRAQSGRLEANAPVWKFGIQGRRITWLRVFAREAKATPCKKLNFWGV